MQTIRLTLVAALLIGLTACHWNPLKAHKTPNNVTFLRQAAISAEQAMQLPARKGGRFYSNCMEGNREHIDCEAFFNHMLQFAKKSQEYSKVTLADLTDAKDYAKLAEDYQIKIFNAVDD